MYVILFMLLVRLLGNSRLLVVKFSGNQKLYADFRLCGGSVPLTVTLFRGQLFDFKIQSLFIMPDPF